ncbi:MAG: hypothetical protein BroJett026_19730 [Betaproteobacteria bacterium]|nr:MAG: hypothetical protein BroJett026_19730 [Betaproteobacteria bacterium]
MSDPGSTLFFLRIVKLVLEVALLALLGQGVVWVLIRAVGADPSRNVFHRTLEVIVSPFTRLVRLITPRVVADRHLPWAVFGLLAAAYIATLLAIVQTCVGLGLPLRECLQRQG